MKKRIISIVLHLFIAGSMIAQISMQNVGNIKVDNLSDAQIEAFVKKYTDAGYSFADVETQAKAQGMSSGELEKLRVRVQQVASASTPAPSTTVAEARVAQEKINVVEQQESRAAREEIREATQVFGAGLFRNSNMTFEPNLNIPTPKNYQLGPGDELIIDIFGFSESTYRLRVAPEGFIRVPNVGQIPVNGQTIENAEKIIRRQMAAIYSTINTGQSHITVTLGNIRSIRVYLIGEVTRPGTYTLSSLATVFNALYACGGPSQNGSLRNIKVLRNGKTIATIDVYSFLLQGELKNNLTLHDEDVIHILPYESHVTVEGSVKRGGIYEMKPDETLADLITFCGGFNDDAYKGRVTVTRNTDNEKSVADVPQNLYYMFYPRSGDKFSFGTILDKYTNRVQITGNVFRPGTYALDEGMTLKDLVDKADGLREDAFMERAVITRLQDDLTPELIAFNVQELIDGKFNIKLKKEDIISIGTKTEFEESRRVHIYGEVMNGGSFPYYENMRLKDLIFMAKGFREFAETDRIEIIRRIIDPVTLKEDAEKVEIIMLSVNKDFSDGGDGDFLLQPRDQVSVKMIEGLEAVTTMSVSGEVRLPGNYPITKKTERISDVFIRAGGLTKYAYPKGAFLLRNSTRSYAERMRDAKLISMLSTLTDDDQRNEIMQGILARTDLVGISLEEILKNPGSQHDLFVENGDIVFVPKQLQTVTVAGSVQVPGMIVYDGGSFKKYINQAGGFTKDADARHSYVAYANGSIGATKRFLFFRSYPEVTPGAHLFIPEKEKKESNTKENISFFMSILSGIVSMASVAVTAIAISNR
ncbi:MAG: SLBB domain-containing protein [Bacteroidales bacterium]|jgi:protein involved in polysaccharide export with SLBB domain|nr:SLBB domain-containing protein [Bacteroidales bacterium]